MMHALSLVLLTALLIAVSVSSHAQPIGWRLVASVPGTIWGADCASDSDCMLAVRTRFGQESRIWKSVDGGTTWQTVMVDTGSGRPNWALLLFDIDYPSPRVALAAADSGWVFRTADGGATWDRIRIDTIPRPTHRISMYDELHGVAVIDNPNRIYVTRDGGLSWREVEPALWRPPGWEEYPLADIAQTGRSTITGILADTSIQRPVRSTDGGLTWTIGTSILPQYPGAVELVTSFVDSLRGWATTRLRQTAGVEKRGIVLRTDDGGISWRVIVDSIAGGQTTTINQIAFTDTSNGILEGFYDIWRTTDGGASWKVDPEDSVLAGIGWIVYRRGHAGLATQAYNGIYRFIETPASIVDKAPRPGTASYLEWPVVLSGMPLRLVVTARAPSEISMALYDLRGARVAPPLVRSIDEGQSSLAIATSGLASGTYLVVVESADGVESHRFHVID